MLTASTGLLHELQAKINILSRDPSSLTLARNEKIIRMIDASLDQLKELVKAHTFSDVSEEIRFYKEVMPEFYALWIYYSSIHTVQSHAGPGSTKYRVKYFEYELRKIDDFFKHHLDFYIYYRAGRSNLDAAYFTRGNQKTEISTDLYAAIIDKEFCTLYSFKLATIIAFERLQVYLNDAITNVHNQVKLSEMTDDIEPLQWTASKTGLYELIYTYYAAKVFNNGQATIEMITRNFEKYFGVRLGTASVTFQEILRRQKGLTAFQDGMKNALQLYSDAIDERARQRRNRKP